MSDFLKSGQVGKTQYNLIKQAKVDTINKWQELGFLDNLKGNIRENIAQLYENEASHLLTETTDANSSGSFETVVFPIVRRVFSKLLANDIVSVQAMNMAIGKLFFFVPVTSYRTNNASTPGYGDPYNDGATYSAHTPLRGALPSCIVADDGCALTTFQSKNLYDMFYNDGLFDNSKGEIKIHTGVINYIPVKLGTNSEFTYTTTFPLATDNTVRNIILKYSGFSAVDAGRLTGPQGNQMDTESFLASLKVTNAGSAITDPDGNTIIASLGEIPYRVVTQKYGKGIVDYSATGICDATGVIYLELDLTHPCTTNGTQTYDGYIGASGNSTSAYAWTATTGAFTIAYASYASLELATEMGEVSFKLDEVVVSVEPRKLRAAWSPELAQDVSAFHNIDAEAELTAMLSEQVAAEIDREILRDLRHGSAWPLRWNYAGWRKASSAASPYTQKEWNQTLITKINQISAQIHKSTLRGGVSFIVVSAEIGAIMNDLEYFHVSDASAEQDQYNMGIERIGSIQGRYQVYSDPYAPSWSVILGHKGKSLLDTGYIYAPYLPLTLTPTMYNPFNFSPVKGISTRYSKKMVNNLSLIHI